MTIILALAAVLAPASQQPTAACKAYAESGRVAGNVNTSLFGCKCVRGPKLSATKARPAR